jgi:RNA polymerase sigma-70 factor (ECF subfamily)
MLSDRGVQDITDAMTRTLELDAAFTAGREKWPGVALAKKRFIDFLLARLPDDTSPGALAVTDIYLACACAAGDTHALAAFDRELVPVIGHAVATTGATATERDDLVQIVRTRLLVAAPGDEAKIATFSGKGSLKAWVRVVATREAARFLAKQRRERPRPTTTRSRPRWRPSLAPGSRS